MIREFREFIMRGNVVDMAVGIIIGAAFGAIVNSMVNDVIMPPVGQVLSGIDFKDLAVTLKAAEGVEGAKDYKPAVLLKYGMFLNAVINFLIIGFVIFVMIKAINRLKAKPLPPPAEGKPTTKSCTQCLEIIHVDARRCKFCTTQF